ncbi:MAG: phosphate signaling complex protein PhoU [Sulfuricella sp.]|nr:phosphate signaling complex protein PhoU [Sulfuricella sp.]
MAGEHIYKQFDAELEAVRSLVLQMGGLVEEQIVRSVEALVNGDEEIANQVIADDHRVNALDVTIDEQCTHIIARRQPTASDLRMVMAVIKTISDLERIGDKAGKIARLSKRIYGAGMSRPRFREIEVMSELVLEMLRKALDAFARLDVNTALEVSRADDKVDAEFKAVFRQLITFMMEDPRTISQSLDVMFVAKAVERIGDHAKNIAEYVIYMVKGKDVRHVSPEEMERHVQGGQ